MADEQASTLAFLQNFYTDVTLYMPFEAHERTPPLPTPAAAPVAASAAAPPVSAAATGAAAAPLAAIAPAATVAPAPLQPAPAAGPVLPVVPVPPAAGKLPSLTETRLVTPAAGTVLAAAPTPAAAVPPYMLTTFSTLGSNAQGVAVLVRLPTEQFNKLPRNVFLNNLLKAIGLVMADIVLVNVEGPYPVALQNLRKEIAATCILAFGKNLLDVAVRTTQIYEPVHFPSQTLNYLAGAEIEMIEYDTSLKKRLWAGLKALFL